MATRENCGCFAWMEAVELGFAEPIEDSAAFAADWVEWQGGKVGGKPVWLVPAALPPLPSVTCPRCERRMVFLAQFYSPVDADDVGHDGAYHRMLYVFVCGRGACCNLPSDAPYAPGRPSVRVFRCQLPRSNPLYVESGDAEPVVPCGWSPAAVSCAVCGLPAPNRCSRCSCVRYCCREHQALHWKLGHRAQCASLAAAASPADRLRVLAEGGTAGAAAAAAGTATDDVTTVAIATAVVLPELQVVVEEEPPAAERKAAEAATLTPSLKAEAAAAEARAASAGAASGGDGAGESTLPKTQRGAATAVAASDSAGDADAEDGEVNEEDLTLDGLTQRKLAEITGAQLQTDPYMQYFQRRTACEPTQVVRYCRWPADEEAWRDPLKQAYDAAVAKTAAAGADGAAAAGVEPAAPSGAGGAADAAESKPPAASAAPAPSKAATGGGVAAEDDDDDDDDDDDIDAEPLGAPLWVSGRHIPLAPASVAAAASTATGAAATSSGAAAPAVAGVAIPPCERCGAPRRFELQITPQLLSYVLGKRPPLEARLSEAAVSAGCAIQSPDPDFGTIALYTCAGSCAVLTPDQLKAVASAAAASIMPGAPTVSTGGICGYVEEAAWVQPMEDKVVPAALQVTRQLEKMAEEAGAGDEKDDE